ncbi:ABC transporter substrate-binding protein [Streptomyces misionensis]|uniref:ABC transporter substrate-binding protein n=1 Tax=Streptomyces misionensis TaxID=67331 RepID=UPI0038165846
MAVGGMGSWVREHVWEIPLRRYLSLGLAVVLVAGGVFGVRTVMREVRQCAPGVSRPAGGKECLGVATGPYDFGQERFSKVVESIRKENDSLRGPESGSYVTVALMLPFSSKETTDLNDVEHQLQGAYLAQYRANHDPGDQSPKIRLVLANSGTGKDTWKTAVHQLEGMTGGRDRLRAVVGIGQSTDANEAAVKELTEHDIAVVGSSITADSLANGQPGKQPDPFRGLARVAPTNADEARALAFYAKANPNGNKAILVYADPGDPYTNSLKQSFGTLLKGSPYTSVLEQPFTPSESSHDFQDIKHTVCDTPPDTHTILFAGRHADLQQFVNVLGDRGCKEHPFQILTGDEASYLTYDKDLDQEALQQNLTVLYTSLAHPDAWVDNPPKTGGSTDDYDTLRKLLNDGKRGPIGPVALDDGQLIIGYDAVRLAVEGIRRADTPQGGDIPTLRSVGDVWPRVVGSLKLPGASGWVCLNKHGNPYDKAVPIVKLAKGGAQFVQLAWPKGKPLDKSGCLKPE